MRISIAAFALSLCACPSDPAAPSDAADVADTTDADVPSDAADVDGSDGFETLDTTPLDAHDTADAADLETVTSWPWPLETITVPASEHWRHTVTFPDEPFASQVTGFDHPTPRWVKFTVFTGDPARVYFQDSVAYPLHYDFARAELPPFASLSPEAFDALTLDGGPGQEALLGALVFAPATTFGGAPLAREVGVMLSGREAYAPFIVETVLALVMDHLAVSDGGAAPTPFYFPTFEQQAQARRDADRLAAAGFAVSGPERWATGETCYHKGWALGRLVALAPSELEAAYLDGRLRPEDVLLTDTVPARIPLVAGLVTTTPATPSSSAAVLAETFDIPFVHLATPASKAAAQALSGHLVALRATGYGAAIGGRCEVSLLDLEGALDPAEVTAITALKRPAALDFPARATLGALAKDAALLTPADSRYFGGTAAYFGLLERTLPEASPAPALAFSFDLWERVVGPVRAQIDARLGAYTWPLTGAALADLQADLAAVRALITGLTPSSELRADLLAALAAAGFEATTELRVRASSNVEAQPSYTGAGLYDTHLGCLADDTDDDAVGPSRCDPSASSERGVLAAALRVYASLWSEQGFLERLRRDVDEAEVAMGLLVHANSPTSLQRATGVATLQGGNSGGSQVTLVTQRAPIPVDHPDGAAQPEVVTAGVYSFGTFLDTLQHSTLVPLGAHVMRWEDDYQALVGLLERVATAWKDALPSASAFWLDFGWRLVERPGSLLAFEVDHLVPRPAPSSTRDLPTYLLPEPPVTLCTFQGEHGAILGNWRLKSRVTLTHGGTWLDAASRRETFYQRVRIERPGHATLDADPSTFEGFTHEPGDSDQWGNPTPAIDGWVQGAGAERQEWTLQTSLPWLAAATESPLQVLADAYLTLDVTYATAQPEPDQWPDGTTTYDSIRLAPCPDEVVLTPQYPAVHRVATLGAVTVDIRFYWPPPPTGPTAGYTAPLAKWDVTTISGLTSSPLVLESYWSQTYRPGHHNFSESFVFDPTLEPALAPSLLAELAAKNIRALLVEVGYDTPRISLIAPDGTLRPLP